MRIEIANGAIEMARSGRGATTMTCATAVTRTIRVSAQITTFAAANNLIRSMGYTGTCWVNAMAESFFPGLQTELNYRRVWSSTVLASRTVGVLIEERDHRRHSAIGKINPVEFELQYSSHTADLQPAA